MMLLQVWQLVLPTLSLLRSDDIRDRGGLSSVDHVRITYCQYTVLGSGNVWCQ